MNEWPLKTISSGPNFIWCLIPLCHVPANGYCFSVWALLRGKLLPVSEMLFYLYTVFLCFLIHASPFSVFLSHTQKWKVIIKGSFQRQSQLKMNIEKRTRSGNLFEHRTFLFFCKLFEPGSIWILFFFFFLRLCFLTIKE